MQHTEVSAVREPAHHYCAKHARPCESDHIANDKVSTSGRSLSHTKFMTCAEMKPSIRLCMYVCVNNCVIMTQACHYSNPK